MGYLSACVLIKPIESYFQIARLVYVAKMESVKSAEVSFLSFITIHIQSDPIKIEIF